jgi:hypothetical protein
LYFSVKCSCNKSLKHLNTQCAIIKLMSLLDTFKINAILFVTVQFFESWYVLRNVWVLFNLKSNAWPG